MEISDDDRPNCCTSDIDSSRKYISDLRSVYNNARFPNKLPRSLVNVMQWIQNVRNNTEIPQHAVNVDLDHPTTIDIVKLAIMTGSATTITYNNNNILYANHKISLTAGMENIDAMTRAVSDAGGVIAADLDLTGENEIDMVPMVQAKQLNTRGAAAIPASLAQLIAVIRTNLNERPIQYNLNRCLVIETTGDAVALLASLVRDLSRMQNVGKVYTSFAHSTQPTNLPYNHKLVVVDEKFCDRLSQALNVTTARRNNMIIVRYERVRVSFFLQEAENIRMDIKTEATAMISGLSSSYGWPGGSSSTGGVTRKRPGRGSSSSGVKRKRPGGGLSKADFLVKNGYVVIPTTVFRNPQCKADFLQEADKFAEFNENANQFVLGGFAALGNPSSFHNPVVRKFRQWAHSIVVHEVFRDLINTFDNPREWKLDHIIGRMVIRVEGQSPTTETWHRDTASEHITGEKKTKHGKAYFGDEQIDDKVFGGWINLDHKPQYFSCIRESHMPHTLQHRGFTKLSEAEAKKMSKNPLKTRVEIPAGSILVFFENIIHEVVPSTARYTMARLHTAFRLTRFDKIRPQDLMQKIDDQAPIMLKSGQSPPMYASAHMNFHIDLLQAWSIANIRPELLVEYIRGGKKRRGERFQISPLIMESLKAYARYGLKLYPPYTEDEKHMHTPQRTWCLLRPGSQTEYITCSLD